MKPKVNRRKKIAKFRAKINKMETKKVKKKKIHEICFVSFTASVRGVP